MSVETFQSCSTWLSGLPENIQAILIDAGIAREEVIGIKLLLAENMLTLTIGDKPSLSLPDDCEAHKSNDVVKKLPEAAGVSHKEKRGLRQMSGLLPSVMARLDELSKNPSAVTGVSTGFFDLDERSSGMQPGDLIIVAGGQSIGKTTFALNVAEYVALEIGLPVLIFSMEMNDTEIAVRFLNAVSKVDRGRLRTGRLDVNEMDRLNQAVIKLHNAPIHVDESTALSVLELCARARRKWHQYCGLGLIVIDYLQLVLPATATENGRTDSSEVSRTLKTLAKELKVPIIAISKLGRDVERRSDKRPLISDLREYGAIELDADVILFIHRDDVCIPDSAEEGFAEIIIGKQRNGSVGTVKIKYVVPNTRFADLVGRSVG